MVGYFNRNTKQEFGIPAAPTTAEPGPPVQGQPTLQRGRQWGVFTIKLPKDFDTKLSWTSSPPFHQHHHPPRNPTTSRAVRGCREQEYAAEAQVRGERPDRHGPPQVPRSTGTVGVPLPLPVDFG